MPLDNRRPPLLHLQLEALGDDTTVRLISPLLHIAPRVSLCFSACRFCTLFRCDDLLSLVPLKALRHLAHFHAFSRWIALQRSKKKSASVFDTFGSTWEFSERRCPRLIFFVSRAVSNTNTDILRHICLYSFIKRPNEEQQIKSFRGFRNMFRTKIQKSALSHV